MANFAINITDNAGNDTWDVAVLEAPTLATGGTALANGASDDQPLVIALQKAMEAVRNEVAKDGNS